ncbi:MAG: glycosyl transferase [Acidobacteria bacterium]|nr:glycosyl transferase [Acidobacteriota bacterium]
MSYSPAGISSRQIRVLRVIARLNVGGPALHVSLLNSGMDKRFMSWLVTGTENPGEGTLLDYALARGVEPVVIPEILGQASLAPRDVAALIKLIALIRRFRPHVVHTHTAKAGFLGRLAAWLVGVPVVLHTYHGHVLAGYYGRMRSAGLLVMERVLARMSDRLIAVSNRVRDDLVSLGVAPASRFTVVPLGLDLEPMFDAKRYKGMFRRELELQPDVPLVGIVGRLFPIKNHSLFLEAAACMRASGSEARFVVVGDGPLRGSLEERASQPDLRGRVFFTGWRHDLPKVYSDLDVLAVSSINEGTPVSAIEAMAAGCAVVATRVGGLPDLIDHARTGILVPSGNAVALGAALGRLLADPGSSEQMRAAASSEVRGRFMASRLVTDVQRLYLELLGSKGICLPQFGDTDETKANLA